jgi:D-tyrosyl-tRNA(Tyr) deacylase
LKAVVQRVTHGSVKIGDKETTIGKGVVILLGVTHEDTTKDAAYLAEKIANIRIFPNKEGKMHLSLLDTGGKALVVPQFTLYGDTRHGRRPDFTQAAKPDKAGTLYQSFIELLQSHGISIQSGVFGAEMLVEIANDGPVTLIIDSR